MYRWANIEDWAPTTNYTIIVRFKDFNVGNPQAVLLNIGRSSSNRILIHCPWSDGKLYFDGPRRVAASGLTFTGEQTWVFRYGSKGQKAWQNGNLVINDLTVGPSITYSTGDEAGLAGLFSFTPQFFTRDNDIYHYQVVNTELSDSVCEEISADPFGLIRPDPLKVLPMFVPAAGGGTSLGTAIETDAALPISAARVSTLGAAQETDAALPLASAKRRTLTPAAGIDLALPLSAARVRSLGFAAETEAALPLATAAGVTLNIATLAETALPLAAERVRTLGLASTSIEALALSTAHARTLTPAAGADQALPLSTTRRRALGIAETADQALALTQTGGEDFIRVTIQRAPVRATAEIGPTRATIQRAA